MSGIISGRARVVFSSPEFLHLSKGGLDGKIVAYRDSWITKSFEMQDWVTFKAKAHEPEGPHGLYGVRYKALPNSVKFESKGKIVDGVGTLLKVDENQGQYGFIKANDGSTVYFTASVVRPETKDIRNVFKTGVQIRYRATEQKQNAVQWRAIAVCSKNASIDNLTGRQPKSIDTNIANRTVVGLTPKKQLQVQIVPPSNVTPVPPSTNIIKVPVTSPQPIPPQAPLSAPVVNSPGAVIRPSASASVLSNSAGSRSSSLSRSDTPGTLPHPGDNSSAPLSPTLFIPPSFPSLTFPTSHPPNQIAIPFNDIPTTGDAYEDAVRRLAYFAHCISDNSCNYCLLR